MRSMPRFISPFHLFRPFSRRHESGMALIGVLWLIALLAVMAGGMALLARDDSLTARAALDDARAQGLADAAVFLAVNDLCDPKAAKTVPLAGQLRTLTVLGHDIAVSVQDEAGKIDINFAPKDLMISLLTSEGLSDGEASILADSIEAARAKVPFRSIDDLKAIAGIDDALLQSLRPVLTIYAQRSSVYTPVAPKAVLEALQGMDEQKISDILAKRSENPSSLAEGQGPANMDGRVFTISTTAEEHKIAFPRRAVVRITGDMRQPFWIYEWTVREE
jgi:general secretion pathway protein K